MVVEPPEAVTFHFGDDVPEEMRELVKDAVAQTWAEISLLVDTEAPEAEVYVYMTLEEIAQAYAQYAGISLDAAIRLWEQGHTAMTIPGAFFIRAETQGSWFKITAHEFTHVVQYALIGSQGIIDKPPDCCRRAGPVWLTEGGAEYLASLVMERSGRESFVNALDSYVGGANAVHVALSTMEDWSGFVASGNGYAVGFVATHLLVQLSGEASLFLYEQNIGAGASWQEAFLDAFGMTAETFYELFAEYQSNGFQLVEQ